MSKLIKIIIAILVIIAVAAGALWYISTTTPDVPAVTVPEASTDPAESAFDSLYESGLSVRESGNYAAAAAVFKQAAESATTTQAKAQALRRAGIANIQSGSEPRKSLGVRQLKEAIRISTDPREKAAAIDDLASTVCRLVCDEFLFTQVFKGRPYEDFYVANDIGHSVTKLYEWGISIQPLAGSYAAASTWYADQLLVKGESLSEAERQQYMDTIENYLLEGSKLANRLRPNSRNEMAYYYWQGYGYGALAAYDEPKYGQQFHAAYQEAIDLGKNAPEGVRLTYALTTAYYQYAALLDRIYGDARSVEVGINISGLMSVVASDPRLEANRFLQFAKHELTNPGESQQFTGQALPRLLEKYPALKDFLVQYQAYP